MLMDIDTSGSHYGWDVILTDESVSCFEASTSTERMHYVIHTQNYIAENTVLWPHVYCREGMNVDWFLGTKHGIMNVHALAQEEFVEFLNIITSSEHALMIPQMVEIVSAYPVKHALMIVIEVNLETMTRWDTCCKLFLCDKGVSKDLELILFCLKKILQDHGSVGLILGN